MQKIVAILTCIIITYSSLSFAESTPSDDMANGAYLFRKFCTLCHGVNGMGEGPLALAVENYPNTNLLISNNKANREEVLSTILDGSNKKEVGIYMPPWRKVFTSSEIDHLTDFVMFLKKDPTEATRLLRNESNRLEPSVRQGELLYKTYCARCHGKEGKGDGRMAKIVKTPPPFDLTKSRQPDDYLALIIIGGGEIMKRSAQMPPWGDELSRQDTLSVIAYIKTLRE